MANNKFNINEIENLVSELVENYNTQTPSDTPQEMNNEDIEANLNTLKIGVQSAFKSIEALRTSMENEFDAMDPINFDILSESDLMFYSPTIDCSVETFGKTVKLEEGQTIDEVKQAFREELVDQTIIETNPIYNYKLYNNSNKTSQVSIGTFVANDYENVEVNDEEEKTYWQIKILADVTDSHVIATATNTSLIDVAIWGNGETTPVIPRLSARIGDGHEESIVNNKYYITDSGIIGLQDGDIFELFVKQGDEFVSANMFIEVYKNTMFLKKPNIPRPKKNGRVIYRKVFKLNNSDTLPYWGKEYAVASVVVSGRKICWYVVIIQHNGHAHVYESGCYYV